MLEPPSPGIVSADPWPDDVSVPTFGPRMVCTRCGIMGGAARLCCRTFAYFHTRPAAPAPSLFLAKSNGCNLSESCHRAVSRVLHFNGSVGAVGERALWDRLLGHRSNKRVRRFAAGGPF